MAAKYRFRSDGVTYKVCNRLGENCIGLNPSVGSGALNAEGGGAASLVVVGFVVGSVFLAKGNQDLRFGGIAEWSDDAMSQCNGRRNKQVRCQE